MADSPRVTVLMPVYNGEKYLREAIDSILAQTFANFEFLIVNDGSTDNSVPLIESYADARIHLVHNATNSGLVASLNKGLGLARGEYIARMDCDDISLPTRLEKQLAFMDDHPEIGILGSACQFIDDSGAPGFVWANPEQHQLIRWHLCFTCPMCHPTVMMRTDLVRELGGYSSEAIQGRETYSGEDYDLWRRASSTTSRKQHVGGLNSAQDYSLWRRATASTQLANLPEMLLYFRRHEVSVTRVYRAENQDNSVKISCLVMSEVLGEPAPADVVASIWRQDFRTAEEMRRAAELIYRLYRTFVANAGLTGAEQHIIRRDAAARLFDLAYHLYHMKDARMLPALGQAWLADPDLISRSILQSLQSKIGRRGKAK